MRNPNLPNASRSNKGAKAPKLTQASLDAIAKNASDRNTTQNNSGKAIVVWVNGYECRLDTEEGRRNIRKVMGYDS